MILFQKLNPSTMPQKHKAAIPNKTLAWLRTELASRALKKARDTNALVPYYRDGISAKEKTNPIRASSGTAGIWAFQAS